ncbi:hypothetical protein HPB52_012372 [Rhipicephalus sanguineus]|uniref:Uncharacterized protein n=1 Tax=Rhipicephalus sanguineus TaxID=34632 RepID=A0A9D4T9U7_RHISA|nr:hypothetical protein HPB52_012372 [Rhipicephalus sanguineus]
MAQSCKRPGEASGPSHAPPIQPDQRADVRNIDENNPPATDDDASTIVKLDEKVDDWSDMDDDNFKMISHRKNRTFRLIYHL